MVVKRLGIVVKLLWWLRGLEWSLSCVGGEETGCGCCVVVVVKKLTLVVVVVERLGVVVVS